MGFLLQIYIALSALSLKFVPACQDGKLSDLFISFILLSAFICYCALLVDLFLFIYFFINFFVINTTLVLWRPGDIRVLKNDSFKMSGTKTD